MKFLSFSVETPCGPVMRVGALSKSGVLDIAAAYAWDLSLKGVYAASEIAEALIPSDMTEFLSRWPVSLEAAKTAVTFADLLSPNALNPFGARLYYQEAEYRLRCALRPRRIKDYLVYEEHKKKSMQRRGLSMPDLWYRMPTYTNRNVYGLADPGQDITWPSYSERLDFEFEIGLVVGRSGRNISARDAQAYIAGFTIYNDLSARDVQADEGKIGAGAGKSKDFDQGNIFGPYIVTPDEIEAENIEMILRIDGEEWSRGNTRNMKFSWGQIIENASRAETIFPGDIFASGTMDRGCGLELDRWIAPGTVIEMEATGIGILRNRIVRN